MRPNLHQQDGSLVPTNERDKNKGEVRFSRSELRVPRDDEDLDYETAISVTQGW